MTTAMTNVMTTAMTNTMINAKSNAMTIDESRIHKKIAVIIFCKCYIYSVQRLVLLVLHLLCLHRDTQLNVLPQCLLSHFLAAEQLLHVECMRIDSLMHTALLQLHRLLVAEHSEAELELHTERGGKWRTFIRCEDLGLESGSFSFVVKEPVGIED